MANRRKLVGADAAAAVSGATVPAKQPTRIGRPTALDDSGEPLIAVNFKVSPATHKRLKYLALDLDTDVSTLVRRAIDAYLPNLDQEAERAIKGRWTTVAAGRAAK